MPSLDRLVRGVTAPDDALAPYRERMALPLTVVCAMLMLPFMWLHVTAGNWVLAGVTGAGQVVAVVSGYALSRGTMPLWLLAPSAVVVIGAVAMSVSLQGIRGVFWAYPTLFIVYFVLPRGTARVCAALLIGAVGAVGLQALGAGVTARVVGTLGLNLALIEVVLRVVQDLQDALAREARTDALTGAWNRRQLGSLLAAPPAPGPDPARGLVLVAIDIDHFKRINDGHGHAVGDRVLVDTVRLIHGRIRRDDQLFRTGGEEFLLALPRTTLDEARALAEALRQRIEAACLLPDGQPVTVSIGVARQHPGGDGTRALRDADRALYAAKASGRNRVHVADAPSAPQAGAVRPVSAVA